MLNKLEKILFVPDCHVPYHDKRAFELMITAMKDFKPDNVIIVGDFIDMYTVSSHSKDPNRALRLEEEVNKSVELLNQIKHLGAKNNVFVTGNHEDRLTRYLQDKAPELFNLISVPKILKLDEMGFKYVPYKDYYKIGKLYVTHDVGVAGKYAHYKALDSFQANVVTGHTHRIGYAVEGNAKNERRVTAMFGWLGDVTKADYMHKIQYMKDWSLGFGVGFLDKATGNVYLQPVPIINNTVCINGKLFKV